MEMQRLQIYPPVKISYNRKEKIIATVDLWKSKFFRWKENLWSEIAEKVADEKLQWIQYELKEIIWSKKWKALQKEDDQFQWKLENFQRHRWSYGDNEKRIIFQQTGKNMNGLVKKENGALTIERSKLKV